MLKIEIVNTKGRGITSRQGWFFRIKAKNGKTLCHSEIYNSKQACEKAVYLIISSTLFATYKEAE